MHSNLPLYKKGRGPPLSPFQSPPPSPPRWGGRGDPPMGVRARFPPSIKSWTYILFSLCPILLFLQYLPDYKCWFPLLHKSLTSGGLPRLVGSGSPPLPPPTFVGWGGARPQLIGAFNHKTAVTFFIFIFFSFLFFLNANCLGRPRGWGGPPPLHQSPPPPLF